MELALPHDRRRGGPGGASVSQGEILK